MIVSVRTAVVKAFSILYPILPETFAELKVAIL
jgi:hypothetical protein